MPEQPKYSDGNFVRKALIAIALAAVAFILWQLREVLVLLFGAVVMATIVRAVADPFANRLRVPEGASVLIAVLLIVVARSRRRLKRLPIRFRPR